MSSVSKPSCIPAPKILVGKEKNKEIHHHHHQPINQSTRYPSSPWLPNTNAKLLVTVVVVVGTHHYHTNAYIKKQAVKKKKWGQPICALFVCTSIFPTSDSLAGNMEFGPQVIPSTGIKERNHLCVVVVVVAKASNSNVIFLLPLPSLLYPS